MKCLRIELRWKDQESAPSDKFFVDVHVDEEFRPHQQLSFLGWMSEEAGKVYPFKLDRHGRLDFGAAYEGDDRWASTNLRSKLIQRSEYATIVLDDIEYTYQIADLTDLTAL